MTRRRLGLCLGAVALTQCHEPKPAVVHRLLEEPWIKAWSAPEIAAGGSVSFAANFISLASGGPMSVCRFDEWDKLQVDPAQYEITYEARRMEGSDFFAALTFPAGRLDRCLSFINGGWGGGTTGLSNIDHTPASDNLTASLQKYVKEHWHHFKITVLPTEVAVHMDQRLIARTAIAGHIIDLRPGDIEACAPLGFASYETSGEVRNMLLKPL
jgi:hypothetical protein